MNKSLKNVGTLKKRKNKINERDICINVSNFGVQLKKENNITIFEKHKSYVVGVGVPDDPQSKYKYVNKPMSNEISKYYYTFLKIEKENKTGRRGRRPLQVIKSNFAITLIALIITIIVLLILAGVTLNMVMGENGIFGKANNAKDKTEVAQYEEELRICVLELQADAAANGTTFNMDTIKEKFLEKVKEVENTADIEFPTEESETRLDGIYKGYEFYIDDKYAAHIGEKATGIHFYYEIDEQTNGSRKITINVQDTKNGIDSVKIQDDTPLKFNGSKKQEKIQYTIEVGKDYKIEVNSMNGDKKETNILIEPEIQIKDPYIGEKTTETNASNSVLDNSQAKGTPLYINFEATLEKFGTTCTAHLKNEPEKVLPYKIEENGIFTFVVSGKYGDKTVEKEIQVEVKKYTVQGCYVKYDAGEWSKEEIEELQKNKLYDVNKSKSYSSAFFTFGGFTYKEDSENEEAIDNGSIITNRNQSISSENGTPKYTGWRILESEPKNGKMIITKLIHAGSPENFVFYGSGEKFNNQRAEYILSGGKRQKEYNTYNARNWDMYKDNNQLKLIEEIYILTSNEAKKMDESLLKTESSYWLASASTGYNYRWDLDFVHNNGSISAGRGHNNYTGYCYGIRPVVKMKDGVYISSGSGTESDPYVLEKEQE